MGAILGQAVRMLLSLGIRAVAFDHHSSDTKVWLCGTDFVVPYVAMTYMQIQPLCVTAKMSAQLCIVEAGKQGEMCFSPQALRL